MSQLLIRFSKFSLRKDALIHKRVRSFSSLVTCCPYLTLGIQIMKHFGDGSSSIGDVLLFDPAKEELVTFPDSKIPKELVKSTLIGSSRGWGLFRGELDRSLCLSDLYNPCSSRSNPKMIPLPPLTALPCNQTEVVRNLAISSPPEQDKEEEDCVIAIKFLGRQLSMYRHGHDLRWTNLELPFSCLDNSNLIFSKRDECFYLPAPGGNYLFSWDLHFNPKFRELVFRNLPDLPQSEYRQLDSCSRAEHWVESSSTDEHFLVKWYSYISPFQQREPIFMVFREEETMEGRYMCYTEDIGDLCIFLSGSDPFCVPASSCPGLKPNSIYVATLDVFAVYDLATKTCREFEPPKGGPFVVPFVPYWLPPVFSTS